MIYTSFIQWSISVASFTYVCQWPRVDTEQCNQWLLLEDLTNISGQRPGGRTEEGQDRELCLSSVAGVTQCDNVKHYTVVVVIAMILVLTTCCAAVRSRTHALHNL